MKKAKQQAEQHGSSWKQREQEFSTLQLEVAELENGVSASARQLAETRAAAGTLAAALQAAKGDHASAEVSANFFNGLLVLLVGTLSEQEIPGSNKKKKIYI